MNRATCCFLVLLSISIAVAAHAEDRFLFRFDDSDAAGPWQSVNDGVMGGRSDGRFKIKDDEKLEFFGTLSLEVDWVKVRGKPDEG